MNIRAVVDGVGAYLPEDCISNDALSARLDTSDEWITTRTGIRQRHIAAEGEFTSDLAAKAARQALAHAGIDTQKIDLVLLATATPDETFPACATRVQQKLGIMEGAAFDINAACSGFVYAMHLADGLIRSGLHKHILVIGAETMSRVVDWEDRRTAILFGDGAGACVVSAAAETQRGICTSHIASDGQFGDMLSTDGGVSSTKTAGVLSMDGRDVFRHAVDKMSQSIETCAHDAGISPDQIRHIVPHQANARILSACAKRLKLPESQFVMRVDMHANTSSASIPLALHHAVMQDRIKPGDYVMLTALGAGFTWGGCLLRW